MSSTFELDIPDKKGTGYKPKTKSDSEDEVKINVEDMEDITTITVEEYKKMMCNDNGPGLVHLQFLL